MYSGSTLAIKFLRYWLQAANRKGHGIHSPFVFEFITSVLNDKTKFPAYEKIESLRKKLLKDPQVLDIHDMGAGSALSNRKRRTVSSVVRNAAKKKKFGQLLFRIGKYYKSEYMVELGTSLGISSAYLASSHPRASLLTIEGDPSIAAKAQENLKTLGIGNLRQVVGNFDYQLPIVLQNLPGIDLAFIDGNHRREPTERYFLQLLEKTKENSILIFDDIHWSGEMEQAWACIKSHPRVTCSIDLFFIGIVFFRSEFREKQHFSIRF